jgi:hypothetical protein
VNLSQNLSARNYHAATASTSPPSANVASGAEPTPVPAAPRPGPSSRRRSDEARSRSAVVRIRAASMRHVGNFRQATMDAWVTVFDAAPLQIQAL